MPYRRRPRRRKSRKRKRQLNFRANNVSAGGGKPLIATSRTLKTTCAAQLSVQAARGASFAFNLSQWNTPADPVGTVAITVNGAALNHPSMHVEALALAYTQVRVLSSFVRFDIRYNNEDEVNKDYVFAYRFGLSNVQELGWSNANITIDNFKDMRQSRGWVWHRMSGTSSGGSVYPSAKRIEVNIPNVRALHKKMSKNTPGEVDTVDAYTHDISDAASAPARNVFLKCVVFTMTGATFISGDVVLDVTVFNKVKITRQVQAAQDIQEADQVS